MTTGTAPVCRRFAGKPCLPAWGKHGLLYRMAPGDLVAGDWTDSPGARDE